MKRKIFPVFGTGLLLCLGVSFSCAQNGQWKVGDVVEAHSFFFTPPWHKAKIVNMGRDCESYGGRQPYHVVFIDPEENHGLTCVGDDELRPLANQTRNTPRTTTETPRTTTGTPPSRGSDDSLMGSIFKNKDAKRGGGTFYLGDRVDVYGKRRGTIIEVTGGRYKVHYDGCESHWDDWRDASDLRPEATISANAPEISFLIGKWVMFTPSYPTTVVRGNTVYREYGMGAKAPPLQINANGTYVWYFDYGKPPVKGTWRTDAKVEGERYTTAAQDGIVIKDPTGGDWKVFRRDSTRDSGDHITAQTMCSGTTVIGTRAQ